MKAISLWQPWASLIAVGAKRYETRCWAPPPGIVGQRIAIHAAKRPVPREIDQEAADAMTDAFGRCAWNHWLPRGAIVCTAVLAGAFQCAQPAQGAAVPSVRIARCRVSRPFPDDFTVPIDLFGDFSQGRWAWLLEDIEPIGPPIPALGRQSFWDWHGAVEPVREVA